MKKYNLSEIMRAAWSIKKDARTHKMTFSDCLKRAWDKAKTLVENAKFYGIRFVNNMVITLDGYTRTLTRWTKGNCDRIYINGGSNSERNCFVDIKSGMRNVSGLSFHQHMADAILSMQF